MQRTVTHSNIPQSSDSHPFRRDVNSGRGIGFQGGFNSGGPPNGYGAPVPPGGGGTGYSGGYGGSQKRDYDGGDDRDQKRARY